MPGVLYDDVKLARFVEDRCDRGAGGVFGLYVEGDRAQGDALAVGELTQFLPLFGVGVAHARVDGVAGAGECPCGQLADACAGAGDKDGGHGVASCLVVGVRLTVVG